MGYAIEQVPITFVDRIFGESKLGANEIIGYLRGLVDIFVDVWGTTIVKVLLLFQVWLIDLINIRLFLLKFVLAIKI